MSNDPQIGPKAGRPATASNGSFPGLHAALGRCTVKDEKDIRERRRRLHDIRTNERPACPVLPPSYCSWMM